MEKRANEWFNKQNLKVSEGEYQGYNIQFDLSFRAGGDDLRVKANTEQYERYSIGNEIQKDSSDSDPRFFSTQSDGTVIGGFAQDKKYILMNTSYDTKMNQLHEIGHTLGLDDNIKTGAQSDLMEYPPGKISQNEANQLGNGDFLPKIEKKLNMLRQYILITVVMLFVSCGVKKNHMPVYATEDDLKQYTGLFYVILNFVPENSHPMNMCGIRDSLNFQLLRKTNVSEFVESFYEQFTYTPMMISSVYWTIFDCMGLNKNANMEIWNHSFEEEYSISNLIEKQVFSLEDSNYIIVSIYKIKEGLNVEYIENYQECVRPTSIELDIEKIRSINKVAVLLPAKN